MLRFDVVVEHEGEPCPKCLLCYTVHPLTKNQYNISVEYPFLYRNFYFCILLYPNKFGYLPKHGPYTRNFYQTNDA